MLICRIAVIPYIYRRGIEDDKEELMKFEWLEERHLGGILSLWNKALKDTFPMRLRLLRQNITENLQWLRQGSWVATDKRNGNIIGFVVSKISREETEGFGIRRDSGWIHALMVDSEWTRMGIGNALLRKAEDALQDAGAKRIGIGNDLHGRIFPGIPDTLEETKQWFEKRGYVFRERVYDLMNAYRHVPEVALPDVRDATLRMANSDDRNALSAFMRRFFPGTWDYQHNDYWERGGEGREYVLLEKQDVIIGFCRINDAESPLLAQNVYWSPLFDEELGGIGPLGIDENFRGHQYGISIVQAAIHYLLRRGVRRMVIDTTPFVDFYGKLGFDKWKSYAKYDKNLE